MGTRREFVAWLSALSLAGLARPLRADQRAENRAVAAARTWLDLVDGGRYEAGWDVASPILKGMVTKEEWDRAVRSVRTPLGHCLSRRLRSHKLVDSFPGAPKGPYAVLQFETAFEERRDALETVTPVLGPDDRWRVAGYFIK